jgi:hypothetical protein
MVIETIPIQGLWRLLRVLPGFVLRWHFTPEKLAQLIYIDLRPRHDSALVDLGQSASFRLCLQAINLSPFSVELDRASFRFWCGGATLNASILKKQVIAPGEIVDLYLDDTIPDGYANQMAIQIKANRLVLDNRFALDGNIEFNCKIRSFAKSIGHLDGINVKVYNDQFRATA